MTSTDRTDPGRPVLVLFRHDLRLADNRALHAAAKSGKPVAAAFVLDDESKGHRKLGGARRWWLHHSITALAGGLRKHGIALMLCKGEMGVVAGDLVKKTGADLVLWNRRYDPPGIESDKAMKATLSRAGIDCESFDGHLLHEPWQVQTSTGGFYKVYTPFWRALSTGVEPRDPLPAPKSIQPWRGKAAGDTLEDWSLLPTKPDWSGGLAAEWTPGEAGAHDRLDAFLSTLR